MNRGARFYEVKNEFLGFTMIELVMVLTIIGILAVFAIPRLIDTNAWRLGAFADQLQQSVAFANRLALNQRTPTTVTIAATGITVAPVPATNTLLTNARLTCPAAVPNCITTSIGSTITFNANSTGRAATSTGNAVTITVSAGSFSQSFAVEPVTGFVHRTAP